MRVGVLRNQGDTVLTKTFTDDGVQVDAGDVTVQVWRADGTELASGDTPATKEGTGASTVYTFTLLAEWLVLLDRFLVEWTRGDTGGISTDTVDIFGGHLFTIGDARAFDAAEFADTDRYTTDAITDERLRITDLLEKETGVSWIPRYGSATLRGDGTTVVTVPHLDVTRILSVTVGGDTVPTSEVTVTGHSRNRLHRASGWTTSRDVENVAVAYEHGRPAIVDGVDRIGLIVLRDRLAPSNVPHRVWSLSNELGTTRYSQPGKDRPTGIPEVDAWLAAHNMKVPVA